MCRPTVRSILDIANKLVYVLHSGFDLKGEQNNGTKTWIHARFRYCFMRLVRYASNVLATPLAQLPLSLYVLCVSYKHLPSSRPTRIKCHVVSFVSKVKILNQLSPENGPITDCGGGL